MKPLSIIKAPLVSEEFFSCVSQMADALLAAGLAASLGAAVMHELPMVDWEPRRDSETKILNLGAALSPRRIIGYAGHMNRFLSSFLIAAVIILVSTFAGMSVMHVQGDGGTGASACIGDNCAAMPDMPASGMGCLVQCLSAIPSFADPGTTSAFAVALLIALLAVFSAGTLARVAVAGRFFHRWREGIGKIFLRRQLASVILRD